MGKKSYPVRIPLYAAGIRAQESRAGGGRSWWSREWMRRLEGMGLKGRLGRGRNYAASGQVLSMTVENVRVTAKVQGARREPYGVTMVFRAPEGEARSRITGAIRGEPMLAARLLADDLPLEVEAVFRAEGFDLFPGGKLGPGRYDMTVACSCPDYANPCKHAAAALLILGEEIARRPATLLELRGVAMEELYDEN
ncbi:MAG: SWIM zinc finger family protein [Kiritimatiellae bacterium]|nr:SWIM zinc finger family protein [Kiritimatiellia bacterium]